MNWDRRKQSEKWVREKVDEFNKTTTGLTFAEWCYQQGRADERAKTIDEVIHELKIRATTIYETGYMCHEYSDDELDEIAEQMKEVRNE